MEQYTVKALLDKLKSTGIQITRATLFVKIKNGVIKPQGYKQIGKRRYPKYSSEYVSKLIACATVTTKLDWAKVKQVSDTEVAPQIL